jgi:hypothetical protein
MRLTFNPVRMDATLSLIVNGDELQINGVPFDFGPLPEGAVLPRDAVVCDWLASDVTRRGGQIELTLILPHGANAPHETRFPAPVDAVDGPVPLPEFGAENAED